MTPNTLPNPISMTANDLGHRAEVAARTGRPLPIIQLADGRELPVRGARFSPFFTTLLYTAGPSDTYRHEALVEVVSDDDPCANCGRDLADHGHDEIRSCLQQHRYHLAGRP